MSESAKIFKPDDIVVELGENKYRLVYDLNCFCELEKIYGSVDTILKMILGTGDETAFEATVNYLGSPVAPNDVTVNGIPLPEFILSKSDKAREVKHSDTRNLLWAGCLHDHSIINDFGEINGYTVTKDQLGREITFKNIREVNAKIVTAILRDLLPPAAKNEEAPEVVQEPLEDGQAPQRLKLMK